ncbi:NUMOD4 motif [Bacteroidales bacterium Barb6]|nr:NUMOD4 motif [Bacteroidales bacterium Barb6]
MKKIEEEWKVIEEAPRYEISNMGRCRNIKTQSIRKKCSRTGSNGRVCWMVDLYDDTQRKSRSVGLLVAKYFAPNPNGYACIRYKDGDTSNAFFMNIGWVRNSSEENAISTMPGGKPKVYSKEVQLENIKKNIRLLSELEKAVQNDTIIEFLYKEIAPLYKEKIRFKLRGSAAFKEECVSWMMDELGDLLNRGNAVISFGGRFKFLLKDFLSIYKNGADTEFIPDYFNHNNQEDTEDDQ